jgi:hypothetical protein
VERSGSRRFFTMASMMAEVATVYNPIHRVSLAE